MKSKQQSASRHDNDQTMTSPGAVAGYPSQDFTSTNELPPEGRPSKATGPSGGALIAKNYSRAAPPRDAYADRVRHFTLMVGESMAKQSFKDECDINLILSRYMRTGVLDHVREGVAQYADVSAVDFQEAQNLIAGARSMFFELPSALRERFANDPANLLAFMNDENNREEAIQLGLVNPKKEEATPLQTPPRYSRASGFLVKRRGKCSAGHPGATCPGRSNRRGKSLTLLLDIVRLGRTWPICSKGYKRFF